MIQEIVKKAEQESYIYYDQNIEEIPKDSQGRMIAHNNAVDAFRHAYVSGALTMKWGETVANALGQLNEVKGNNSNNQPESEENMDLYNNSIGRKYGKIARDRQHLAELLKDTLENDELIITTDQEIDNRQYEPEDYSIYIDPQKPVIVLRESETGRNELFLDLLVGTLWG